jgi:tRNA(adenine34) deaminase
MEATMSSEVTAEDIRRIRQALRMAEEAIRRGGAGVAAILARGDEIFAAGCDTIPETGDLTSHAEMVVLRTAGRRLQALPAASRREVTLYCTLEPCLMCFAALSFVGIRRAVYSALSEDANVEQVIVEGLSIAEANRRLRRGPLVLVPGVCRDEGRELLRRMGKQAGTPPDLRT